MFSRHSVKVASEAESNSISLMMGFQLNFQLNFIRSIKLLYLIYIEMWWGYESSLAIDKLIEFPAIQAIWAIQSFYDLSIQRSFARNDSNEVIELFVCNVKFVPKRWTFSVINFKMQWNEALIIAIATLLQYKNYKFSARIHLDKSSLLYIRTGKPTKCTHVFNRKLWKTSAFCHKPHSHNHK